MAATFTKLRDGSWGLRIEGSAKAGQTVTVTKKSGETSREVVGKIIWSGNGITLAKVGEKFPTIGSGGKHYDNRTERDSDGAYCGYPCPVTGRKCCPANGPCNDCQG